MAKCDQGYLCQVCGDEVQGIAQSDLYLRYVIGRVDPEQLHLQPERHLLCNPNLAQYIDHAQFPPVEVAGEFDKRGLDTEFVRSETELVTRGFSRLLALRKNDLPIVDYPLPEFRDRYSGPS